MPEDAKPAPFNVIMPMVRGFMASQALHAAARLKICDALAGGPKTADEIAPGCGANPQALYRLMRCLTTVDILREDAAGRFTATPLGDMLRADHPQSVRPLAVMFGDPLFWQVWGDFTETVKQGVNGFSRLHGEGFFSYLGKHPEKAAMFNAGMSAATGNDLPALLDSYDLSSCARIVDVGGGHGALLRGILDRYPRARGVLFDLPNVVAGATALKEPALAARCELHGGDMFKEAPPGGDTYILKRILHDWSDEESVRILKNIRAALAPGGRLLVLDAVIQPSNRPDPGKWMDLNMLAILTGRERTEAEFAALYRAAGFTLARVIPTPALPIVEGLPA